jgi:large subunit ribosomal protein L24
MMSVRKNDTVAIIKGKDKGKQGTVLEVLSEEGKVMVQGSNLVKRHTKARKQDDVAGIVTREAYLALSNVMPVCPSCKKPCRINVVQKENKNSRACNRCKEAF